ncbi:tyrosine-type recombinase/integrase [Candidatus Entotheonella palauensis]|uniref:tyrosine-type recombinase/integrase n=1 Tax=Candidatus Entotheonella palauensis TaxID=93172 RepID=UPI0015C40EF3|nr:tyrosine-type recombinase/integrase [Candidatus Entotheonella palauensis]
MADLQQFRYGHVLEFMSPENQALVAHYLTLLQSRQYAPLTLEGRIRALKSFCDRLSPRRRCVIARDLTQTTAEDIDDWLQTVRSLGLAPSTIHNTLTPLRQFFAYLHDEGHLARQPIRRHRHGVILPESLPCPMAEADIVAFFRVIDSVRNRLIFLLMLRCGLRVSEVQHLTWSAVNWEAESVRIDKAKGQVDRVVYYTSDVAQALRQRQALGNGGTAYVFPSPYKRRVGQPLSKRGIQHLMTKYCQQAQLTTSYSSHNLRHNLEYPIMPSRFEKKRRTSGVTTHSTLHD